LEKLVLNLNDLPPNVSRLAAACLVHDTTAAQLMRKSAEDNFEFAREAGFTSFGEYMSAVDWVTDFLMARSRPSS
jgi:hypothetical protein